MLERRRCHPLYIVERLFRSLGFVLVVIITSIISGIEESDLSYGEAAAEAGGVGNILLYSIIAIVAIVAVVAFIYWIDWRNKWISAEDNTLIFESGVLVKKRVTIPFSKINTIDMGRNLFQRMFGTCRLKVDTGAIDNKAEENAEMNLVFSLKDAEDFRSYILNRSAQDEQELRQAGATAINTAAEPRWAARARFSDFLLYGLTSSSVWKLFCSVVVVVCFLGEISTSILMAAADIVMPYAEAFWNAVSGNGVLFLIVFTLIFFVGLTLVANLISVAYAALRFYGFRVAREGDNVVVRYGLISLKNYTVQAENVHAVIVKQNLFQQIIGRCSVEMVSIGYGNEEKETNLLFPIIQKKKLNWLINTLLPEYSLSVESHKPEKRSIRFIIVRRVLWTALLLTGALAVCWSIMDSMALLLIAAVVLLAIVTVDSIMQYRNNALGCDGKVMMTRSGGMRVTTHLIRVDAVQSIAATSGIFQRPRKVASYRIDYHAPAMRSVAMVSHMNDDILHELDAYILK